MYDPMVYVFIVDKMNFKLKIGHILKSFTFFILGYIYIYNLFNYLYKPYKRIYLYKRYKPNVQLNHNMANMIQTILLT